MGRPMKQLLEYKELGGWLWWADQWQHVLCSSWTVLRTTGYTQWVSSGAGRKLYLYRGRYFCIRRARYSWGEVNNIYCLFRSEQNSYIGLFSKYGCILVHLILGWVFMVQMNKNVAVTTLHKSFTDVEGDGEKESKCLGNLFHSKK